MRVFLLWLPVAAYMAALFWLSSRPVLPEASLLPDWLNHDWLHHGLAYAGLALVTLRAVRGDRARIGVAALFIAWLIATVYGITDELHQAFVPGRTPDIRDVVADAAGAALALGGAWAWGMIKRSS